MELYRLQGYLDRIDSAMVTGWVRSEDRPDERIAVDLLADDALAASGIANHFRSDLYVRGRYDGQHGFQFRLADGDLPPGAQFISVSDSRTGRIFVRARIAGPLSFDDETSRLDMIERELIALRDMIDAPSPVNRTNARLRDGFGVVGRRLRGAGEPDFLSVRPGLETLLSRCAFPFVDRPAFSAVILARSLAAAAGMMEKLGALFAPDRCEMLIANLADDPLIRLAPTVRPAIRVIETSPSDDFAEAILRADAMARSNRLVVFDASMGNRTDAFIPRDFPNMFRDERLVLGPSTQVSSRDGERLRMVEGLSSLVFSIERSLFRELGGVEPRLRSAPSRAAAELGVRAELLGVAPLRLFERPAGFEASAAFSVPTAPGWSSMRTSTRSEL